MSADTIFADWPVQAATSWKLTLPCTRAEAEALTAHPDPVPTLDPPPTLMTSEPDEARPDAWRLDAYFEGEPDARALAAVRALAPSASGDPGVLERLDDEDWVTASQAGMEPVRAGRFYIHTSSHRGAHRGATPPGIIAFEIDAGRAFGTGHHETTAGCLQALDELAATRVFRDIADIGTGTGLLAFAALALWPSARAIASDIDPISIDVTRANAAVNRIPEGDDPGEVELVVADGMDAPAFRGRKYDLLVANILAGPLIELAPSFSTAVADGGILVLAGLLDRQADVVEAAYAAVGVRPLKRIVRGDWPTLVLRR